MGDWKSEMVWFIADDAVPDPLPESIDDFLNDLVGEVEASGQPQLGFDSYSNDQYVHLSMLLQCYDSPADAPLHNWQEFDFVQLRFHPQAECQLIATHLSAWEAAFLADPSPVCAAIQRHLQSFEAAFAPRHLIAQIDADFLLRLYALNDGRGYHADADCPAAALLASIPVRTNTLSAVNQAFGYIRAIRDWMHRAERKGQGLVCMIY